MEEAEPFNRKTEPLRNIWLNWSLNYAQIKNTTEHILHSVQGQTKNSHAKLKQLIKAPNSQKSNESAIILNNNGNNTNTNNRKSQQINFTKNSSVVTQALIFLLTILTAVQTGNAHLSPNPQGNYNNNMNADQISLIDQSCQNTLLKRNFSNLIVEIDEIITLEPSNYFQGQLFNYRAKIKNDQSDFSTDMKARKFSYLSDPYTGLNYLYTNPSYHTSHIEPLPRSTLVTKDDKGAYEAYFVDRNFVFKKYDLKHYNTGSMKMAYEIPLNTSYINGTCSDLISITNPSESRSFILFCDSMIQQPVTDSSGGFKFDPIQIYVFINATTENDIQVKYIAQQSNVGYSFDMNVGIKPIWIIQDIQKEPLDFQFAASRQNVNGEVGLDIFRLNFTKFEDMAPGSLRSMEIGSEEYITNQVCQVQLPEEIAFNKIIDLQFISVNYETNKGGPQVILAVLVDNVGVVILGPNIKDTSNIKDVIQRGMCGPGEIQAVISATNTVSIYKNEYMPGYLFLSTSIPPSVGEINIQDPNNPFVYKVYQVNNDDPRFVGTAVMTVNFNYVLHTLIDIVSQEQIIRVYCRNSTQQSLAKYHIIQAPKSISNFYIFPNIYLNTLWYRDEQMVNITLLTGQTFTFNGSADNWYVVHTTNMKFQVDIVAWDQQKCLLSTSFNFTVISKNNTQVYTPHDKTLNDIYYNCGDKKFSFKVTDFFNGPNFDLYMQGIDDSNKSYFEFMNQNLISYVNITFGLDRCQWSRIFEVNTVASSPSKSLNMVCVDYTNSIIMSYQLNPEENEFIQINNVSLPQTQIYQCIFDNNLKLLIVMTQDQNNWIEGSFRAHFFETSDIIIWKRTQSQTYIGPNSFLMSYNKDIHYGIQLLQIVDQQKQIVTKLIQFVVDPSLFSIFCFMPIEIDPSNKGTIIKTQISSMKFLFCLYSDYFISVYETNTESSTDFLMNLIVQNQLTNGTDTLHGFDLIDDNFLVVYRGQNQVEVYQIDNYVRLSYVRTLPLYDKFQNYSFYYSPYYTDYVMQPIVDYAGSVLAILYQQTTDEGAYSVFALAYEVTLNQHNTFIMGYDFSSIIEKGAHPKVFLYQSSSQYILTVMNGDKTYLFNMFIYNKLILKQNETLQNQLVQKCSKMNLQQDGNGIPVDVPQMLEQIFVKAVSLFPAEKENQVQNSQNQEIVTLRILSQNQGLAIKSPKEFTSKLAYSNTDKALISVENIFDGFNISYSLDCSYVTIDGEIGNCSSAAFDDSKTDIYNFFIEFVTQQRQVAHSFQLHRFFIIFDTSFQLTFLDSSIYLNQPGMYNGYTLAQVGTFDQLLEFDCTIQNYIEIIDLNKTDAITGYSYYLMIYQCKGQTEGKLQIKFALVLVQNQTDSNLKQNFYKNPSFDSISDTSGDLYIVFLQGYIVSGYLVKDTDILISHELNFDANNFRLIVVYNNEGSFSNTMDVYQMSLDFNGYTIMATQLINLCTYEVILNTFRSNQITMIPNSSIAMITLLDYGFFFFDMLTLQIIKIQSLVEIDQFSRQYADNYRPFEVYNAIGNWPFVIHVLTNYGIFIFDYNIEMTNQLSYLRYEMSSIFTPVNSRIVRTYFDEYNYQIAGNQYGYVFLAKKYNDSDKTFDVYLTVVSFFSEQNTRLYKMIYITSNQECISLNLQTHTVFLGLSPEDELPVNFVCGTSVYMVRVCLRPRIVIDFSTFTDTSQQNGGIGPNGILSFNNYTIGITGSNQYTTNVTQLMVSYKHESNYMLQGFYISVLAIISFTLLGFLMLHTRIIADKPKNDDSSSILDLSNNDRLTTSSNLFQPKTFYKKIRKGLQKEQNLNNIQNISNNEKSKDNAGDIIDKPIDRSGLQFEDQLSPINSNLRQSANMMFDIQGTDSSHDHSDLQIHHSALLSDRKSK